MDLGKIKKIYFIGIGGIGISAVARILKSEGYNISGSNNVGNEITEQLKSEAISVAMPQVADNVPIDADLIVYTVAVPDDNLERVKVKELGIEEVTYPQLLGAMMVSKYGIGVSGTNGKTSTTAMLGLIFMKAQKDPTIVVGSKVNYLKGNSRVGKGEHFIFESDEYRRAFVNYNPKIAIVTYITADHFDYYKDLDDIKEAFNTYLKRVPKDGTLVINADDSNSLEVTKGCEAGVVTYGIKNPADVEAKNIKVSSGRQSFDLYYNQENLGEIILSVPAEYNVYNALAAASGALVSKISFDAIKMALEEFKGTWRRFESLGYSDGTEIITDYAHTPDAVEKTIEAANEFYPDKKILAVFQPHQYSRTKNFFDQFVKSFDKADKAVIFDIFYVEGREDPKDFDVSSQKLVEEIKRRDVDVILGTKENIRELASEYDVALIMGAGDIYNVAKDLINEDDDSSDDFNDDFDDRTMSGKNKSMQGGGFSQQKKVVEDNNYYNKASGSGKKIVDRTK
jgi:UDP-N-acetylmuramate--alanine ligase